METEEGRLSEVSPGGLRRDKVVLRKDEETD